MLTLEVIVPIPHSLKVVGAMGGLEFTGGSFTRVTKHKADVFLYQGDEATLREAERRLKAGNIGIAVLWEASDA